jgi:hypothetical protein
MRDPEAAPHAQAYRLLRHARELVVGGWTAGARARDKEGRPVDPTDPSARSWSLPGAIEAAVAGHLEGPRGDGELARARGIALAALTAAIRGDQSENDAVRYLDKAIRELGPSQRQRVNGRATKANDATIAVRCLRCGTRYRKEAGHVNLAATQECPKCSYQGWSFADDERGDGQDAD